MSLSRYKAKRSFDKSPEPEGGKPEKNLLRFVIQKHAASHLHYDFRLEIEGVLKSWAIPKGPSTDTSVKRLAMMVEDHPYDYRSFEGIIPAGQYGGGTVIVWDEGTYEAEGLAGKSKKVQEKHLLGQLSAGNIKFNLNGSKLKGGFALVKIHGKEENAWLLIKHHDEFATGEDITLDETSAISGRTLEEVKAGPGRVWNSEPEPAADQQTSASRKTGTKSTPVTNGATGTKRKAVSARLADDVASDLESLLKSAPEKKEPGSVKPMLATLVDVPFDNEDYTFEVKWDGYRALAYLGKDSADLVSRNNKSFNDKFYPVHQLLKDSQLNAVLDGEIVVVDDKGVSAFGRLQNWRSEADGELVYYVFDLLWYEGKDLTGLPLSDRQAILKTVLPTGDDRLRLSTGFKGTGIEFFKAAAEMGLEGVIAKKLSSLYTPALRSKEWLKIKVHKRQEVVIAGYTKNDNTSKQFSSLLLGVYENKKLHYVGKVGTGFSDKDQQSMMVQFKPLLINRSPFDLIPDINKPSRFRPNPPDAKAFWLKPELVCEVTFAEITADGVFRHPSFQGMRTDKKAIEVIRETETSANEVIQPAVHIESEKQEATETPGKAPEKKHTLVRPVSFSGKKTLLNPADETQVRSICNHELKFTHLSKVYWPENGYTKRDLFNFYYQVADFILPYLKDRPLSLNRFPGGIHGPSFYQKDVSEKAPDWAHTFPYTTSDGEHKHYLVGNDEATLLWMVSLGCIEMNPWFSRVSSPDNPDYCVIDLDPDKNSFDQVIQVALGVKSVLDTLGVPSFPKTSGSTGMHIYIPLGGQYTYDQSQLFARLIVGIVQEQFPGFTSLERLIKNRNGKMYLDFLQNRPGATIAGPYSVRPKPGATVSMPLDWAEVRSGLKMQDFTIISSVARLKETGDLFAGVLGKGIALDKVIEGAGDKFAKD